MKFTFLSSTSLRILFNLVVYAYLAYSLTETQHDCLTDTRNSQNPANFNPTDNGQDGNLCMGTNPLSSTKLTEDEKQIVRKVSRWTEWSDCDRNCVERRLRTCTIPVACYVLKVPKENYEYRFCRNAMHCLSKTTAVPIKSALREIISQSNEDMKRKKHLEFVIFDLVYKPWTKWGPCSGTCKSKRKRICAIPTICGRTVLLDMKHCNGFSCSLSVQRKDKKTLLTVSNERLQPQPRSKESILRQIPPDNNEECGVRQSEFSYRIVGGNPAMKGSWPWQVALLTRYRDQYCGGTLIGRQWVLTAAHCVRRRYSKSFKRERRNRIFIWVRIGAHDFSDINEKHLDIRVSDFYIHPSWNRNTIDGDIALLKLKRKVVLNQTTKLACLPEQFSIPTINAKHCYTLGWGKIKDSHVFGTDILMEANIPVVSDTLCQQAFDYRVSSKQLCAGYRNGGVDSCAGDSGGPLLCPIPGKTSKSGKKMYAVYGVTSFGEGCGDAGKYGIYTRVSEYSNWIRKTMERYNNTHRFYRNLHYGRPNKGWK